MKLTFADGVALVAGGSGGIGSAVVAALADCGVPVAFTYRSDTGAAERLQRPGVRAYAWGSSTPEDAAELLRRVREECGAIRFLVVATGVSQEAAFHGLPDAELRRLVDTNLTAAMVLVRASVTSLMKQGDGRIVLLGSVSGQRGIRGHTVYAATKAGLEGFTRALAQETGAFGTTVNCVAPGFIETAMTASAPEQARRDWIRRIPAGRLGRSEEVAGLVGYLLSEQAAYVTGQTFVIDGGISL